MTTNRNKDAWASLTIGADIRAIPQACWRNAQLAIMAVPRLALAEYVEGWVIFDDLSFIPIEHGWLELDGKVIDPTITERDGTYYTGLRWTLEETLARFEAARGGPLAYALGGGPGGLIPNIPELVPYRLGYVRSHVAIGVPLDWLAQTMRLTPEEVAMLGDLGGAAELTQETAEVLQLREVLQPSLQPNPDAQGFGDLLSMFTVMPTP